MNANRVSIKPVHLLLLKIKLLIFVLASFSITDVFEK